jgi:hypothetical protein
MLVRKIVDGNERHVVPAPLRRGSQVHRRIRGTEGFRAVDDEKNAHALVNREQARQLATLAQIGLTRAGAQLFTIRPVAPDYSSW